MCRSIYIERETRERESLKASLISSFFFFLLYFISPSSSSSIHSNKERDTELICVCIYRDIYVGVCIYLERERGVREWELQFCKKIERGARGFVYIG